jgi:predicted nucleotidyltransferase
LLVEFKGGNTLFDIIELENSLSEIFKKKVTIVSKRGLSKYIGPYILREAESIGEGL